MFKVGDYVEWESQSAAYWKVKRGMVVAVVPADVHPNRVLPAGYILKNPGMRRDHESYLVQVGPRAVRLYWPRVKHLRAVTQ